MKRRDIAVMSIVGALFLESPARAERPTGDVAVSIRFAVAGGADSCGMASRVEAALRALGVVSGASKARAIRVDVARARVGGPWRVSIGGGRAKSKARAIAAGASCAEEAALIAAVIERGVRPVFSAHRREERRRRLVASARPAPAPTNSSSDSNSNFPAPASASASAPAPASAPAAAPAPASAPLPAPAPEMPAAVALSLGDAPRRQKRFELLASTGLAGGTTRYLQGTFSLGVRNDFSALISNRAYIIWRTPDWAGFDSGHVNLNFVRLTNAVGFSPFNPRFPLRFEALATLELVIADATGVTKSESGVSLVPGLGVGVGAAFQIGAWSIDVALRFSVMLVGPAYVVDERVVKRLDFFDLELAVGGGYAF